MNIKKDWILTELAGEYVAVPVGENTKEFRGMIKLNETGRDIWNGLVEGLDEDAIAKKMVNEYEGLSEEKAVMYVRKVIEKLQAEGLLEE